jgi:hypothetical protein
LFGREIPGFAGSSLFRQALDPRGLRRGGGIDNKLAELERQEVDELVEALALGFEDAAPEIATLSPKVQEILTPLLKIYGENGSFVRDLEKVQIIRDGIPKFTARPGHFGISNTFRGDFRVPVEDAEGRLVNLGAGNSFKQAKDEAQALAEAQEGLLANFEKRYQASDSISADLDRLQELNVDSRAFRLTNAVRTNALKATKQRGLEKEKVLKGTAGSVFDPRIQAPSKKELREIFRRNVFARERLRSEAIFRANPEVERSARSLLEESPDIAKQLSQRLDDLAGRKGPVETVIDNAINAPLKPFLGGNAGTKIIRSLNKGIFNWTLGAGDVGFPILNAFTAVQTVLPELAYVVRGAPETVARHYSFMPMFDSSKRVVGNMGVLEPLKLMKNSFKEMKNPDDDLREHFLRAATEGVVAPKFTEEFTGSQAAILTRSRDILAKEAGFTDWLFAASELMPTQSEKFARGQAFTVGHMVARDIFKGTREANYQFAKEFTENTMFLYQQADRARIFSGAVGSSFGMFKNWTTHYIANFMKYTSEGAMRGNWQPLMWAYGGIGAIAGVGGTVGYGAADTMSELFSDKTATENLFNWFGYKDEAEELLGEEVAETTMDTIFYGLPGLLGTSLQSRGAAPGAEIGRDVSFMSSFAAYDRAAALGRALGTSFDRYVATGEHPVDSGNVRDQFYRALLPKTLYRWMAVNENNVLRSLRTGNSIMDGIGVGQRVRFALGMIPTDMEKGFEASRILFKEQDEMRKFVSTVGAALLEAELEGDYTTMTRLTAEAAAHGVLPNVYKSANSRRAKVDSTLDDRFDGLRAERVKRAFNLR